MYPHTPAGAGSTTSWHKMQCGWLSPTRMWLTNRMNWREQRLWTNIMDSLTSENDELLQGDYTVLSLGLAS